MTTTITHSTNPTTHATRLLNRRPNTHGRPVSQRSSQVIRQFGAEAAESTIVLPQLDVPLGPGRITAFVGPSGSGKTTALGAIEAQYPKAHNVERIGFPNDRPIIDCIAPSGALDEALHCLSLCGLGEPRLWLREYAALSEGERFRARIARAVGAIANRQDNAPLLIDAFGDSLHRRAARALAYNVRRLTTRRRLNVVVATCHHDVLADLQPDNLITLTHRADQAGIREHAPRWRPFSLWRNLKIEPGRKIDYARFASMHYRTTAELGFVDKVFVLRQRNSAELLGIVVYAYPPAGLALRNRATKSRFVNNLELLNQQVRIIKRLVVHPDLRGCGIAHRFVRRTLPLVGTRYIECLASMGAVNPIFERAGMKRIGICPPERRAARLLKCLKTLDVDPFASDFETQVCRRPIVREIATMVVARWYQATSGQGRERAARQPPDVLARICRSLAADRPVYYLWERKNFAKGECHELAHDL